MFTVQHCHLVALACFVTYWKQYCSVLCDIFRIAMYVIHISSWYQYDNEFVQCKLDIVLFHTGLGWPLNYHFMFDLLAVLALLTIVLSLFLPKTVEKKREVFVNVNRILQ